MLAPPRDRRIRVVLVDDDDDFREAAAIELDHLGFDVVPLRDGDTMLAWLARGNAADVIVLDWHLPRRLGIEILRTLRDRAIAIPVLILTGNPETAYESAALDSGAEDFVDKSRGMQILARRIHRIVAAATEGAGPDGKDVVRRGRLRLDLASNRAQWNGADVNLTVTEFNIVRLLVSRGDGHVTYRAIYDCVHRPGFVAGSGDEGFRTNVRSAIRRIRDKFRVHDAAFAQIENFAAFGYRWRADPPEPI